MKLSDFITVAKVRVKDDVIGYEACFAGEDWEMIPTLSLQPTKQMATQALIDNAILARRPIDHTKQP